MLFSTKKGGEDFFSDKFCPKPGSDTQQILTHTLQLSVQVIRHVLHKKSREESSQLKKRQNSYSSIYKGLEKEKGLRENKERKNGSLSDMSIGTYTALGVS